MPRVAYVWTGPPAPGVATFFEVFVSSLQAYGWVDGQTVTVQSVSADNQPERYPQLVDEVVKSGPNVILIGDSVAAPIVAAATDTIPIVLTLGGNVVAAGQTCSFNRPCGNVTGLSLNIAPLSPKRLEMLKQIEPGWSRVGFLRNLSIAETELELAAMLDAGRALGVEIIPLEFRLPAEIEPALESGLQQGMQALVVMPDGTTVRNRAPILAFTARHNIPDAYGVELFPRDGGLFSYGADREHNFRRAAWYVDRLLRGAKPGELPIQQPDVFELILNLKRANELGLSVPRDMLRDARTVIR